MKIRSGFVSNSSSSSFIFTFDPYVSDLQQARNNPPLTVFDVVEKLLSINGSNMLPPIMKQYEKSKDKIKHIYIQHYDIESYKFSNFIYISFNNCISYNWDSLTGYYDNIFNAESTDGDVFQESPENNQEYERIRKRDWNTGVYNYYMPEKTSEGGFISLFITDDNTYVYNDGKLE